MRTVCADRTLYPAAGELMTDETEDGALIDRAVDEFDAGRPGGSRRCPARDHPKKRRYETCTEFELPSRRIQ
jgi:hypothetical protein